MEQLNDGKKQITSLTTNLYSKKKTGSSSSSKRRSHNSDLNNTFKSVEEGIVKDDESNKETKVLNEPICNLKFTSRNLHPTLLRVIEITSEECMQGVKFEFKKNAEFDLIEQKFEKNKRKIQQLQKITQIKNEFKLVSHKQKNDPFKDSIKPYKSSDRKYIREMEDKCKYKPIFPQNKNNLFLKSFRHDGFTSSNYRSNSIEMELNKTFLNKSVTRFSTNDKTINKSNENFKNNSVVLNKGKQLFSTMIPLKIDPNNFFDFHKQSNRSNNNCSNITHIRNNSTIDKTSNIGSIAFPKGNKTSKIINDVKNIFLSVMKDDKKLKKFENKLISKSSSQEIRKDTISVILEKKKINIKEIYDKHKLNNIDHFKQFDEKDLETNHMKQLAKCDNKETRNYLGEVYRKIELEDRLFNKRINDQSNFNENKIEFLRIKNKIKNIAKETIVLEKKLTDKVSFSNENTTHQLELEDFKKMNLDKFDSLEWNVKKQKILKSIAPLIFKKLRLNNKIRKSN